MYGICGSGYQNWNVSLWSTIKQSERVVKTKYASKWTNEACHIAVNKAIQYDSQVLNAYTTLIVKKRFLILVEYKRISLCFVIYLCKLDGLSLVMSSAMKL